MGEYPRTCPFGDQAILIEFGAGIHPEVHYRVRAFYQQGTTRRRQGVGDLIPSYASVVVQYDPLVLSFNEAADWIRGILASKPEERESGRSVKEVPVLYGGGYGPDIPFVAGYHGIRVEEVIQFHTCPTYLVYVIGGFPGLAAMGTVSEKIETPRLSNPRRKITAGSVAIAGRQTGIYAVDSPGGWQLIGRTPLRLFNPSDNPPSYFQPGDRVRFYAIGEEKFLNWGERTSSAALSKKSPLPLSPAGT